MPRGRDFAVGAVAALVLSSAASQAGAQADTSVEALLRLHHDQRIAHVERAPERLVALFADPVLEVSGGALAYRSRRESEGRFGVYLAAARFLEWDDVTPPVIHISEDS